MLVFILLFHFDPNHAFAQSTISVTQDKIVSAFPDKLTFQLSVNSTAEIQNIKLLYRTNGDTCQSEIAQQVIDFTPASSVETEWDWDFTISGILPPGAEIYWQWQIDDANGGTLLTDEHSYKVNDTRQTWYSLKNDRINLQWYKGSQSFGQGLLDIATRSIQRMEKNAGVTTSGMIWVTIYPTILEVQEVDIHAAEWAAGLAYPEYDSTIMAIDTTEMDWAASVIPHELAHLMTDVVVFNCRGMWLPTWLSEGLAMYAEGDISEGYIYVVTTALDDNELPPLRSLESGFSSISDAASISYGQSGMVVTYMIDQYGPQKMTDLLAAIQSGSLIDQALKNIYGKDTDGVEAEWRISLGFDPQPTLLPTSSSRTSVPTLALWTSAVRPTEIPTSLPSLTPTLPALTQTPIPLPSQTFTPVATSSLTTPTVMPGKSTSSPPILLIGILAVVFLLAIGVVTLIIVQRNRRKNP